MILFASNGTGWDEATGRAWPGGMTDTMIRPITYWLDQADTPWQVDRYPHPGKVNSYLATASIYSPHFIGGPCSPMICHGIADKNYRTSGRGGMHPFSHIVVPGPAHASRAQGLANVVILGYPKLVPLFDGTIPRVPRPDTDPRIRVLWAPTHGGGGEAGHLHDTTRPQISAAYRTTWWDRRQILDLLPPDRYVVTRAPHPRHRRDRAATLAEYASADVVIADAGSTIYEAWAVDLPVVFCDWLTGERITARPQTLEGQIYRRQLGYHVHRREELADTVEKAAAGGIGEPEREFIEQVLPTRLRGEAGALHAQFLTDLYNTHRTRLEEEAMVRRLHDPTGRRQREQLTRYLQRRRRSRSAEQPDTPTRTETVTATAPAPVVPARGAAPTRRESTPADPEQTQPAAPQPAAARTRIRVRDAAPAPAPPAAPPPVSVDTTPAPEQGAVSVDDSPVPEQRAVRPVELRQAPPKAGRGSGIEQWQEFLAGRYDPRHLAELTRTQLITLHEDGTFPS